MIRYGINSIIVVSLQLLTFSPLFSFTNVVLVVYHSLALVQSKYLIFREPLVCYPFAVTISQVTDVALLAGGRGNSQLTFLLARNIRLQFHKEFRGEIYVFQLMYASYYLSYCQKFLNFFITS